MQPSESVPGMADSLFPEHGQPSGAAVKSPA